MEYIIFDGVRADTRFTLGTLFSFLVERSNNARFLLVLDACGSVMLSDLRLRTSALPDKGIRWFFIALILISFFFSAELGPDSTVPAPDAAFQPMSAKASELPAPLSPPVQLLDLTKPKVLSGTVQKGQTPTRILNPYLPIAQIYAITAASQTTFPLTRIQAGKPYRIYLLDNELVRFDYEIDADTQLVIQKDEGGDFTFRRDPIPYDIALTTVRGIIDNSFFETLAKAGEKPELALRLAGLFAWDIDFVRDIRRGDTFSVLVDKRFKNGVFSGYGTIHAARFINNGRAHYAFRFTSQDTATDYYDDNGRSLRKAFLKAPLAFSRISSGYSKSRMHPILKVRKPHRGIDYAAPIGTPVKTVGDGVVVTRSRTRAAGKYLKIRHPNGYETIYNHLSRYARNIRPGTSVTQGQVIGYVGQTGYATGPHLDFRIKKNGVLINPLTLKTKPARPVRDEDRDAFHTSIEPLMARLDASTLARR